MFNSQTGARLFAAVFSLTISATFMAMAILPGTPSTGLVA